MAMPRSAQSSRFTPHIQPERLASEDEAQKAMEELRNAIRYHNRQYYELDAPVISDAEYDQLMENLRLLEEKLPTLRHPDSPTQEVGAKPRECFTKAKHPLGIPMVGERTAQFLNQAGIPAPTPE
jgi:NAD-dependent DNA ligase